MEGDTFLHDPSYLVTFYQIGLLMFGTRMRQSNNAALEREIPAESPCLVCQSSRTSEPRKKPSYFPLYWLLNRDPYNGLL